VAEKALRFHIVRWTPKECLAGFKTLRDGRHYSLQEAFTSPALFKLDVIGLVQNNRYTDFSIIYTLKNGKHILNPVVLPTQEEGLKEDVEYYLSQGEVFKALKRMFSLARLKEDDTMIEKLNGLLNGDLGRIYSILSDVGTLQYLLGIAMPKKRILYEIDQFKQRLGNIYTITVPKKVLDIVLDIEAHPEEQREVLLEQLEALYDRLSKVLNLSAESLGHKAGILPPKINF
jgi:hypothetical protein